MQGSFDDPAAPGGAPVGARCARHPDAKAAITCERCGNYACELCAAEAQSSAGVCRECRERGGVLRYHVVPPRRLLVFQALTGGAYATWWFYKNWSAIKRRDRSSISPIARALFGPFTYFWLLRDVNEHTRNGFATEMSELGSGLAIGFLAFNALSRLPSPYWLIALCSGFFLLPTAQRIAEIEGPAALEANRPLRARHYVLGTVCALAWSLAVLGMVRSARL